MFFRYFDLEERHGKLELLANVNFSSTDICRVKVSLGDKVEFIEIDTQRTLRDLKQQVQQVFGYTTMRFHLYYKQTPTAKPELMNGLKYSTPLYRFELNNDAEFIVELSYKEWKELGPNEKIFKMYRNWSDNN